MKPLLKIFLALATLALAESSLAGTHVWSGAGANSNWSTAANWSSGGVPVAGEAAPVVLVFPANATSLTTRPNIANLNVDTIQIATTGNIPYSFENAGVTVNLTGTPADDFIVADGTWSVNWYAPLRLGAVCVFDIGTMSLPFSITGVVSGPGSLYKRGTGSLRFSDGASANTFTGILRTEQGDIELAKIAGTPCFSGTLEIAGGTCLIRQSHQIPDTSAIVISSGALRTLPDYGITSVTESIGPLTLHGSGALAVTSPNRINLKGTVTKASGTGTSTLSVSLPSGQLTLDEGIRTFDVQMGTIRIDGNLSDGGALPGGITKKGLGDLEIISATSFNGPVLIDAGSLKMAHNQALGTTVGGTTVGANGKLTVGTHNNITMPAAEALNVSGTVSAHGQSEIPGPVTVNGYPKFYAEGAGYRLTLSGILSGSSSGILFGGSTGGTVRLSGSSSNTYFGSASISGGTTLELAKSNATAITGTLQFTGGKAILLAPNQIADSGSLLWTGYGEFALNGFNETVGHVWGSGIPAIQLGDATLTVNGTTSVQLGTAANKATITGSSSGKIRKLGSNTWTLFASSGGIGDQRKSVLSVEAGTVDLNGTWDGEIRCLGGSLHGSATVAKISGLGGQICLCDFTADEFSGQTPGIVSVKMAGNTPGSGFDRMIAKGPVNLNGQTLQLTLPSFVPTTSAGYRIIVNDTGTPIQGTFAGLPEGAQIMVNGYPFTITYKGGDGNDVELLFRGQGTPGPEIVKVVPNGNNTATVYVESAVGTSVRLYSNPNLQDPWTDLGTHAVDANGLQTLIASTPGNPRSYFFRLGFLSF